MLKFQVARNPHILLNLDNFDMEFCSEKQKLKYSKVGLEEGAMAVDCPIQTDKENRKEFEYLSVIEEFEEIYRNSSDCMTLLLANKRFKTIPADNIVKMLTSLESDKMECLIILIFEILQLPLDSDCEEDRNLLVDALLEIYYAQNELKFVIIEGFQEFDNLKYSYLLEKYALEFCNGKPDHQKVKWFCGLFKINPNDLVEKTLDKTLPILIQLEDPQKLNDWICIQKQEEVRVAKRLISHSGPILAHLLIHDIPFTFYQSQISQAFADNQDGVPTDALLKSNSLSLIYHLLLHIPSQKEKALKSLNFVMQQIHTHRSLDAFLHSISLGVLSKFTQRLHSKSTSTASKTICVQAFHHFLVLLGPFSNYISSQTLLLLQFLLNFKLDVVFTLWTGFIVSLSNSSLLDLFPIISTCLMNIYESCSHDQKLKIIGMYEYMVNEKSGFSLNGNLFRISDIPETPEWDRISNHLKNLPRPSLKLILPLLETEYVPLLSQTLKKLKALPILDTSDDVIQALVGRLLVIINKYNSIKDLAILSCECLGLIGAIDPARFIITGGSEQVNTDELEVFSMWLIEGHLVPLFKSSESTIQECVAFAIQELLSLSGYTKAIVESAGGGGGGKVKSIRPTLADKWRELPTSVKDILEPLLSSRYFFEPSKRPRLRYPFFRVDMKFNEWIIKWSLDLVGRLGNFPLRQAIEAVRGVMDLNASTCQILLPFILQAVLTHGDSSSKTDIQTEFCHVLLINGTLVEEQRLCIQTIFRLVDHLSRQLNLGRIKSKSVKKRSAVSPLESEVMVLDSFISSIPQSLLALSALRCDAYARALMHYEQYFRQQRCFKSHLELQPLYGQLQSIYSHLEDTDSLEGIKVKLISPNLEQQVLIQICQGRWTDVQSGYEILLQKQPENTEYRNGYLSSLQNMGHYGKKYVILESMLNYCGGFLGKGKSSSDDEIVVSKMITASWRVKNWSRLESLLDLKFKPTFDTALAQLLLLMHRRDTAGFQKVLLETRSLLINPIAAGMESYHRSYESVTQLAMLHEVGQFHDLIICQPDEKIAQIELQKLLNSWSSRLDGMSTNFRLRETTLTLRRALIDLSSLDSTKQLCGKLWLQTAKEARKIKYFQTGYSAILQAVDVSAEMAQVEQAKWFWHQGEQHQAMRELENAIGKYTPNNEEQNQKLRKMKLLLNSWVEVCSGLNSDVIVKNYIELAKSNMNWGKANFLLGRYYNRFYESYPESEKRGVKNYQFAALVVRQYSCCLGIDSKYLYQVLPRMLSLWFDLGAAIVEKSSLTENGRAEIEKRVATMNTQMRANLKRLPTYQFLTALPQLISRICHPNDTVQEIIELIIIAVLGSFPHQSLWHLMAVSKSTLKDRSVRVQSIFSKAKVDREVRKKDQLIAKKIQFAETITDEFLNLCNYPVKKEMSKLSMNTNFPRLNSLVRTQNEMIIPLQTSLTPALPTEGNPIDFNPFGSLDLPVIIGFKDNIDIMASLQRPRKVTILGSDGREYIFLCKPDDDLRKDNRLMELNGILNKLLKHDPDSRKKQLRIRTYAVVPLNEKCGLIQWITHMSSYRSIVLKAYRARNMSTPHNEMKELLANRKDPNALSKIFTEQVLPRHPPIFYTWFLESFPEPAKWLASRAAYTATIAVMSMVGYVVGLGDRHGENILFDELSGDGLHVDLNCLFEKGKDFEIPERVPFRLTHNMVDAFGVMGVKGPFTKSCEASMNVLRSNRELLMSVLETFLHDPLCEWSKHSKAGIPGNLKAVNSLKLIDEKLQGLSGTTKRAMNVSGQVAELISQATDPKNLALMYIGWAPYI